MTIISHYDQDPNIFPYWHILLETLMLFETSYANDTTTVSSMHTTSSAGAVLLRHHGSAAWPALRPCRLAASADLDNAPLSGSLYWHLMATSGAYAEARSNACATTHCRSCTNCRRLSLPNQNVQRAHLDHIPQPFAGAPRLCLLIPAEAGARLQVNSGEGPPNRSLKDM